jgi:hypothetical protein
LKSGGDIAADTEGTTTTVVDTTNLDTVYPTNVVRRKDLGRDADAASRL